MKISCYLAMSASSVRVPPDLVMVTYLPKSNDLIAVSLLGALKSSETSITGQIQAFQYH